MSGTNSRAIVPLDRHVRGARLRAPRLLRLVVRCVPPDRPPARVRLCHIHLNSRVSRRAELRHVTREHERRPLRAPLRPLPSARAARASSRSAARGAREWRLGRLRSRDATRRRGRGLDEDSLSVASRHPTVPATPATARSDGHSGHRAGLTKRCIFCTVLLVCFCYFVNFFNICYLAEMIIKFMSTIIKYLICFQKANYSVV